MFGKSCKESTDLIDYPLSLGDIHNNSPPKSQCVKSCPTSSFSFFQDGDIFKANNDKTSNCSLI